MALYIRCSYVGKDPIFFQVVRLTRRPRCLMRDRQIPYSFFLSIWDWYLLSWLVFSGRRLGQILWGILSFIISWEDIWVSDRVCMWSHMERGILETETHVMWLTENVKEEELRPHVMLLESEWNTGCWDVVQLWKVNRNLIDRSTERFLPRYFFSNKSITILIFKYISVSSSSSVNSKVT
jgi:hypothetical protein